MIESFDLVFGGAYPLWDTSNLAVRKVPRSTPYQTTKSMAQAVTAYVPGLGTSGMTLSVWHFDEWCEASALQSHHHSTQPSSSWSRLHHGRDCLLVATDCGAPNLSHRSTL